MYNKVDIRVPYNFDFEMAKVKGLLTNEEVNENYYKLITIYKLGLDTYLNKVLNITAYDDVIKNGIEIILSTDVFN